MKESMSSVSELAENPTASRATTSRVFTEFLQSELALAGSALVEGCAAGERSGFTDAFEGASVFAGGVATDSAGVLGFTQG